MHTIIVRDHGVDRHFTATSAWDATFLFDALSRGAGGRRVELWKGDICLTVYDPK